MIGGIAGGGLACGVVDHVNDSVANWAGKAADDSWNWTTNAVSDAGDTVDRQTVGRRGAPWVRT